MDANLSAASSFIASHARTLDSRRFQLLVEEGDPSAVLAAVDAYRNSDGGYGWGLEWRGYATVRAVSILTGR